MIILFLHLRQRLPSGPGDHAQFDTKDEESGVTEVTIPANSYSPENFPAEY
jgi:hypothetical protein